MAKKLIWQVRVADYRIVVIFQVLLIVLGLTLSDVLFLITDTHFKTFIALLFLFLGGVYIYFLWALLRRLATRKWVYQSKLFVLIGVYIAAITVENPLVQLVNTDFRPYFLFFVHSGIFLIEVFVIAHTLKDVFSGKAALAQKIWATAAVYLMIVIAFGSVYDLLVIVDPYAFGVKLRPGFTSYAESIYFSIKSMVKMDAKYQDANKLVHHISVIQSVWNDLFIALLVGNVLSAVGKQKAG